MEAFKPAMRGSRGAVSKLRRKSSPGFPAAAYQRFYPHRLTGTERRLGDAPPTLLPRVGGIVLGQGALDFVLPNLIPAKKGRGSCSTQILMAPLA